VKSLRTTTLHHENLAPMAKTNAPNNGGYKTRQEIALEYKISPNTLKGKLKVAGIELPPGRVSPKDQKRIYEALGSP